MSKLPIEYLKHIRDEIDYLGQYILPLGEDQFMRDESLKRAAVRSLEIIGEAIKQIPEDFRQQYPAIDWKSYAGLRDKLVHHYFGVDYQIVWDIVKNEMPALRQKILELL